MGPANAATVAKVTKASHKIKGEHAGAAAVPEEKRAKKFRSAPTEDVRARIGRAYSQRMYLIDEEDISSGPGNVGRKYAVLGSIGNVYDVRIERLPTCSCPDCERGNLCKHIIFVMAKVLQISPNSPLIYQRALLQSELTEMFANAPKPTAVILAKKEVVTAYKKHTLGTDEGAAPEEAAVEVVQSVEAKEPEGECPVCFESLTGGEALDSCGTCRNFIHKDCLKNWLQIKRTCCYCRSAWCSFGSAPATGAAGSSSSAPARDEGYLNLANHQGLSGTRDSSTYHRGRNGYGYGYHRGGYGGRYGDDEY